MSIHTMKLFSLLICIFVAALVSCSAQEQVTRPLPTPTEPAKPSVDSIRTEIDRVLDDSLFASAFIGIDVVSLRDGKVLYSQNRNKLFHPASNMKLFTTSAALNTFDSGFQCRTVCFTDGKIIKHVVNKNLILRGGGDPFLSFDDLDSMAGALHRLGIKSVRGNLVGNTTYFDDIPWGPGWMWDDEPDPDEAFISALCIDQNSVKVIVRPGQKSGRHPEVSLQPPSAHFKIRNTATTSSDTAGIPLHVTRLRGSNEIDITGRVHPRTAPRAFTLSVREPAMYTLELFKDRLRAHGISVQGHLVIDSLRGTLRLAETDRPLDSIVVRTNKESDNLGAENLLKMLGAEGQHAAGSTEGGIAVLKSYLAGLDIDTANCVLADGSGVSFYNAVTPAMITKLLDHQYHTPATFKRFYESLPVAGNDGTLHGRMRGSKAQENVHAKTGSLTGVSALSGYVTTADGKLLAFSILANHFPRSLDALRRAQDTILTYLADYRFPGN
ncbi:MAG TPA: D-alanyl-D-alanine carboxypeptidase/D-alanyl-D-alanine-endopeptidase [Bacteroidota bacterium]|nr:D-alanyl-D-alanine carboxypeptidase/D-alanyl-D-alanine-endopeptidase [Bacteroidota bacterium]